MRYINPRFIIIIIIISNLLTVLTVKNLKFYKSKMAAAAILKIVKSPYLGRGSTDIDEILHDNALWTSWPSWPLKFKILQIQDGGGRHLENRKMAISQPWFERFRRNLARWCSLTLLTVPTVKKLKFQKSKMAATAILKNRKIAISRPRFNRYWRNLARWCILNLSLIHISEPTRPY